MTGTTWDSMVKWWVEWNGRNGKSEPVEFPKDQIVIQMQGFNVDWVKNAVYLNLPPNVYAVITNPDGNNRLVSGGYNALRAGYYHLYLIDKRDRACILRPISEVTQDGARVSFTVNIRYKVTDPLKVLQIAQPLQTYFDTIEADVKEYIRAHRHDEIVDMEDDIDGNPLERYVVEQQARHASISRAIELIEIRIKERQTDPALTEMRKTIQVQEKQNLADSALQQQKKELELKGAERQGQISEQQAQNETRVQDILTKKQRQEIALENERNQFRLRQERYMKAFDAISQTITAPGYPRDSGEIKTVVENLLKALKEEDVSQAAPEAPPDANRQPEAPPPPQGADKTGEKIDDLTNTLLNLLKHRS